MSNSKTEKIRILPEFKKRLSELVSDLDMDYKMKDLSEVLGVSSTVVTKSMTYGIAPKPRTLMTICDNLNCSIDFILAITDDISFEKADSESTFQIRLELLKEERNLKNNQISSRLPIDRSLFTIWKKENYIPSLDYIVMLAKFFKVSIDFLLGRTVIKNYENPNYDKYFDQFVD